MASQSAIVIAALLTHGLNGRKGLPMILWGEPGTIKSAKLKSIAEELGMGFNSTIASICEPADLAGYPIPNEERTMVNPLPPPWIHRVNSHEGGCVQLFDEATSCSSMAHAALMRITLEGKAGDVDVNPNVRFMMAANPVDCAANAQELAIPLANRFGHLNWDPGEPSDWIEWLQSGTSHKRGTAATLAAREAQIAEGWPAAFARAKGLVGSFIRIKPQLLHKMPDVDSDHSSLAWPSRRTWEMATRAIAGGQLCGLSKAEQRMFIAAFIGNGPAGELHSFIYKMDLPDPQALLSGKAKFEHKASRVDRTIAVLGSCAAFLVETHPEGAPTNGSHDQWAAHWEAYYALCTKIIASKGAELVVPSAKVMVVRRWDTRVCPELGLKPKDTAAYKVMLKITPMIEKVASAR